MTDFDESKHPRDAHGRFGAGLATWASRYAKPLADKIQREGGATYKPGAPRDERVPKSGIMVSRDPKEGLGHVIEIAKMANTNPPPTVKELRSQITKQVQKWLEKSLPAVASKSDHYLGGFIEKDEKTGKVIALHLDVSQRFETKDKEKALQAGRDRNQISVWHVEKNEEIKTGGTGRTA